jgi:hypothetical protein
MPSVTDIQSQQQSISSTIHGKSTPPPTQQTTSTDTTNADPLAQAILALEKKQRNLGKRKVNHTRKILLKNIIFYFRKNWKVIKN